MEYGGELAKGIKSEQEHIDTAKKLYEHKINPSEAAESIAREHLKEDENYYSKLGKMERFDKGGAATSIEDGDIVRGEYFTGIYGNF
jgi:predicted hydrolase (HD superfamily)